MLQFAASMVPTEKVAFSTQPIVDPAPAEGADEKPVAATKEGRGEEA